MDFIAALSNLGKIDFFNMEIIDFGFAFNLGYRFLLNLIFAVIVLRKIYYNTKYSTTARNAKIEHFYVFLIFNILVFFASSLLAGTKVKMGFAFGLFAIFSILRYRTVQMEIREMTFLFVSIILAVVNSLVTIKVGLVEILFVNGVILGTVYFLEEQWMLHNHPFVTLQHEKIELVGQKDHAALIADIQQRTGLKVKSIEIKSIDFLKDSAKINVYYDDTPESFENHKFPEA